MPPNPALVRTRDAVGQLGLAPETLRRFVKTGRVAAVRTPGGHLRFREADLAEFTTTLRSVAA